MSTHGRWPLSTNKARGKGHIAIVTPDVVGPVKNGGIGTACFHYARTLANAGHAVDVLFSGEVEQTARRRWAVWYAARGIGFFTLDDVPPVELRLYGCRWYSERALRIMAFLRSRDYDYLIFQDWHGNGFWTARARRLAAAFSGTAIGLISHAPNQWQKAGMRTLGANPLDEAALEWTEKETIASVDILISPSHHMIQWLRDHDYQLPDRVEICPYTFEDPVVTGSPETVDRDHIIFFGRLETRKGLHLFGGALRDLKRAGARMPRKVSLLGKLAQVEDRPTATYLRELQLELEEVEFHVETNFDYMQAVRYIRRNNGVVVIPSILDNFPLTVIECITNGFCFIASDAGGIPEMVDRAVCFPATVEGLLRKLKELPRIDFARLAHPYDPRLARATWLAHVEAVVAEARASRQAEPPARALREEMPPISVCVPYYRHDCYLPRMVSRFLGMDLPQLQFVVVDDGTPPEESACFDMLRRELEPLGHVFHRQENAGPGAARNRAVSLARYDLLLFFDSDNCPFPDMVERLWSAMARSSADMVCAPHVAVPPMLRRPLLEDALFQYLVPGGPVSLSLVENVVGDVCSLVRRPAFEALGGFSEVRQAWEDWEFFLRAVAKGFRHYTYPEPLFYYTYDPEGRNARASEYENRLNLFDCLSQMPSQTLCEVVRIFVAEHLVSRS